MEALYLMDLLGLYQEAAAEKMEVSRPTFARIIKSARHKVALALAWGSMPNYKQCISDLVFWVLTYGGQIDVVFSFFGIYTNDIN